MKYYHQNKTAPEPPLPILLGTAIIVYQKRTGIENCYMFDAKTVTIEKKTNQAMMCPNIMMLFMYINERVHLISH